MTTGFDWTYYAVEDIYTPDGEYTYDNPAAFLMVKARLLDDRLILSPGRTLRLV